MVTTDLSLRCSMALILAVMSVVTHAQEPSVEPDTDVASDPGFVGDLPTDYEILSGDAEISPDENADDADDSDEAERYGSVPGPAVEEIVADENPTMDESDVEIEAEDVEVEAVEVEEPPPVTFDDWLGYNASQRHTTWLADDDFGMFSIQSFPTLELDDNSALMFGCGFHFLNGPIQPDVRPRLFDFEMAYHMRGKLSHQSMLDFKMGVGAFSDFEGSARKGVRFPGHAVLYHGEDPHQAMVLGVEVLDRDDISLLPVVGCIWQPQNNLILEMVFPRPKLRMKVNQNQAFYISGELGGGTWAIERAGAFDDNMTYRDLRVLCGLMTFGKKSSGVLEIGVAFDRELEYRSGVTSPPLGTAFMLRCNTHY